MSRQCNTRTRTIVLPSTLSRVPRTLAWLLLAAGLLAVASLSAQPEDSSAIALLQADAAALAPLVTSDIAKSFLAAVPDLPRRPGPHVVYLNRELAKFLSESEYAALDDSARLGYEKRELDEQFYYYTRYGTPLAFVRPLDLLGNAGLTSLNGAALVDFGFGSIGQLRLLASLGATVTGIDVDPLLRIIYHADTGAVPLSSAATGPTPGSLHLRIGSFPADSAIAAAVPGRLDAFISKNTLKRGYIHPEREVDPRLLIDLGVDDRTFVQEVYDRLKPGGLFLIYNLHPARSKESDEKYIPWSDGRSPFERSLFESVGFEVLAIDVDDTEFARTMGDAFGWGESMDYEKDLFGMYTLVRKRAD